MEFLYSGCAEFVVDLAIDQHLHRLLNASGVKILNPARQRILLKGILNVHRDKINKILIDEGLKLIRGIAVSVQLYFVSQVFDSSADIRKSGLEKRFSARDADPVKKAFSLRQHSEEVLYRNITRLCELGYQARVLAEGTDKVASRCENRAGNQARVIKQRYLLRSRYSHCYPSLSTLTDP